MLPPAVMFCRAHVLIFSLSLSIQFGTSLFALTEKSQPISYLFNYNNPLDSVSCRGALNSQLTAAVLPHMIQAAVHRLSGLSRAQKKSPLTRGHNFTGAPFLCCVSEPDGSHGL